MATILSYIPLVNRLVASRDTVKKIDIPPVEVHTIETEPDKRPRTLKHPQATTPTPLEITATPIDIPKRHTHRGIGI